MHLRLIVVDVALHPTSVPFGGLEEPSHELL